MNTLNNRFLIKSVGFAEDKMFIELNTSKVLTVPYSYTKKLQNDNSKELKNYSS